MKFDACQPDGWRPYMGDALISVYERLNFALSSIFMQFIFETYL